MIIGEYLPKGFRDDRVLQELVDVLPYEKEQSKSETDMTIEDLVKSHHPTLMQKLLPPRTLQTYRAADGQCTYSSHGISTKLGHLYPNIRIVTLPKNSTSVTQPLDTGIIAVFKRRYRDLLLQLTLRLRLNGGNYANIAETLKVKVSNLQAWKLVVEAWAVVKALSIRNCYRNVPIFFDNQLDALSTLRNSILM
ncbi:hypothetical protein BGX28_001506 [Mortierella sp. GBA30]|nr:hypothetical protein BGX28_001506 [Mortierella sp. GBA30]